jgi:hypothetical protein
LNPKVPLAKATQQVPWWSTDIIWYKSNCVVLLISTSTVRLSWHWFSPFFWVLGTWVGSCCCCCSDLLFFLKPCLYPDKGRKISVENTQKYRECVNAGLCLRASPGVLTPDYVCNFSHPSVVIYLLFCNPTHNTETRSAHRLETTDSTPRGPVIMNWPIRNRE